MSATDEPALAVESGWLVTAIIGPCDCAGRLIETNAHEVGCSSVTQPIAPMPAVVAALEANGYVVLPRKELDELLAAATNATLAPTTIRLDRLAAAAAVVEAVGPTREDTKA